MPVFNPFRFWADVTRQAFGLGRAEDAAASSTRSTPAAGAADETAAAAPVDAPKIAIDQLVKDASLSRLRRADTVNAKKLLDVQHYRLPGIPYREVNGGPVELFHGSILEGSVDHGGIQPHYVVDLQDARIASLLKSARGLRDEGLDFHARCAAVKDLVAQALTGKKYDEPAYLTLLHQARASRKNVTPGDYLDANAGVCREHALLTHLALREAGVETRYLYVKVVGPDGRTTEDHAVALAFDAPAFETWERKHDASKAWIVDAYNPMFDGRQLACFTRKKGSKASDASRPDVDVSMLPDHWLGYGVKLLDYPTYWVPMRAALPAWSDKLKNVDVSKLDYSKIRVISFDR